MNVEEEEAPPNKSPSPPLRQPSDYDSPPHLSTDTLKCDTETDLPNFSNALIAGESTGATTTSMDNKDESAVLDDVAVAEGGEVLVIEDEIVVEVSGNEGTDVDLESAKVEEEEANLIIGEEVEVGVRDEKSIASNFMVEEEDVGEQQLEDVEQEQRQEQEEKDHNLMGEEEDVGEQHQEEEQDHNLMGEEEDVGEKQQEEVEQEQEEEEEEGEEEHEREQEQEEEDEEQERGEDDEDEGEEQEREEEEEEGEQGEEEAGADGDIGFAENKEAGEEMEVEVAEEQSGSMSGGKRKRGSGVKNSKSNGKVLSKKKMEEDVCFICFDGGDLVLCDRR